MTDNQYGEPWYSEPFRDPNRGGEIAPGLFDVVRDRPEGSEAVCALDNEDDAARIVACVNLCAGIPNYQLPFAAVVVIPDLVDGFCSRYCPHVRGTLRCKHGWDTICYRPRPGGPCPRAPKEDSRG